jgi:multisubunit Na+/H+ antiporter MnhB subunit
MSLPVRTVSRFLTPLIFIYAIYLVVTGIISPGGTFGGGVVVGVAACLGVVVEEGGGRLVIGIRWANSGRNLGFVVVIVVALIGLLLTGSFLDTGISTGFGGILGSPMVIILSFAAGLIVGGEMVIALVEMLEVEEDQ